MKIKLGHTMLDVEREAGRRADWHVLYRDEGKLKVDAIWADETNASATVTFCAFRAELGLHPVEIVKIVPVVKQ